MKKLFVIDASSRITVPKKIRARLGWNPGDRILFEVRDGKLIVEKDVEEDAADCGQD